jgi:hypothetical protein
MGILLCIGLLGLVIGTSQSFFYLKIAPRTRRILAERQHYIGECVPVRREWRLSLYFSKTVLGQEFSILNFDGP